MVTSRWRDRICLLPPSLSSLRSSSVPFNLSFSFLSISSSSVCLAAMASISWRSIFSTSPTLRVLKSWSSFSWSLHKAWRRRSSESLDSPSDLSSSLSILSPSSSILDLSTVEESAVFSFSLAATRVSYALTFPLTSASLPSMRSLYFSTSSLLLSVSLTCPLSRMFFCVRRLASRATSSCKAAF